MTGPVVIVSRDEAGAVEDIRWCENERAFYLRGAAIVLTFNRSVNLWWGESLRIHSRRVGRHCAAVFRRLAAEPYADVSGLATHYVPEPGAPLEPIPGRAA